MKINEIKNIINQVIAEAKKENEAGLPKSGGKLVHLKKELEGLKKMQESVSQLAITEGEEGGNTVEYAHMQKYVNEYNKIKAASAKLSETLSNQISLVEEKIKNEKVKIKAMMGMDEARFEKGEDVGKPGKGFAKIVKSAAKQYGSKEAGQKVAGAVLKNVLKNK